MARPTKKEIWKRNIGYGVTKLNETNVKKLGEAFAIGATIHEACDYADVAPKTYYNWIKKNPELLPYFDRMREKLPLKAKHNIAQRIHGQPTSGDIPLSKWLVERKQPDDYGETLKMKHDGEINTEHSIAQEDKELIKELHTRLKTNLIKRSRDKAKQDGEIQE